MPTHRVLLVGQSLLLAAVAACLADAPGIRLVHAPDLAHAAAGLADTTCHVVIFDLAEQPPAGVLTALLSHPALSLLGLDPECNRVVVLSGQEFHALTLQQFRELVISATRRLNGA